MQWVTAATTRKLPFHFPNELQIPLLILLMIYLRDEEKGVGMGFHIVYRMHTLSFPSFFVEIFLRCSVSLVVGHLYVRNRTNNCAGRSLGKMGPISVSFDKGVLPKCKWERKNIIEILHF